MIYKTEFGLDGVDEQELCDLVNQLAKVSGQKIEIEKQIVFSTDDVVLSSMLDQLHDTMLNGNAVSSEPKKMISRFELNRRLAEHVIEIGTELHSPKYGKIIVCAQTGADDLPYVVVDSDGNVV